MGLFSRTPTVPVLRFTGPIGMATPLRPGLALASVAGAIEKAFSLSKLPTVAVVVNSPGGSPVQSNLIFRRIRQLAKEKEKRVYVFCEDVKSFDVKYWDNKRVEWRDEWRTMKQDMQPNRLPERVKVTLGVWDPELGKEVKYSTQTLIFMQERLDFSR